MTFWKSAAAGDPGRMQIVDRYARYPPCFINIIYEDWDFLLACLHGQTQSHVPISSVMIHKSPATAPENMRRGNARDDMICSTMTALYRKHPAPNLETRLARQSLMASAGVTLALDAV